MKAEYRLSVIEIVVLVLSLGVILWSVPSCDKRPVSIEPQYEREQGPDPDPEQGGIRVNPMPIIVQTREPSYNLTDDDLIMFATRYKVISDGETQFTPEQKDRLREIDPEIQILRYLNIAAVYGDTAMQRVLELYPDWIMRDANGDPVPSRLYGTGLWMDPGSEGWRGYLVQMSTEFVTLDGYDGIMGDEVLMVNRLDPDFQGINRATGLPYTTEEYRDDQYEIVLSVREAIGTERTLFINNVKKGTQYFEEQPYRFVETADGVVAEGFRGTPGRPPERPLREDEWLDNIEMMQDVQSRGKGIVVVMKLNSQYAYDLTQIRDYNLYIYATFLLGVAEGSYYSSGLSDLDSASFSSKVYFDYMELNVGSPLGDYEHVGSYYQREFKNARVVANPTWEPLDVNLGRNFTTLGGATVSQITLGPCTGTILLK
jgi:hypothetical protein